MFNPIDVHTNKAKFDFRRLRLVGKTDGGVYVRSHIMPVSTPLLDSLKGFLQLSHNNLKAKISEVNEKVASIHNHLNS